MFDDEVDTSDEHIQAILEEDEWSKNIWKRLGLSEDQRENLSRRVSNDESRPNNDLLIDGVVMGAMITLALMAVNFI